MRAPFLTLRGYYKRLPTPLHPKQAFVKEVAERCRVTETTVRNWIMYSKRPDNPEHIKILSEITGIPEDQLWID